MTTAAHRVLLVPDARPKTGLGQTPKVRRYRLARLRVAETHQPPDRFAHIAKAYD